MISDFMDEYEEHEEYESFPLSKWTKDKFAEWINIIDPGRAELFAKIPLHVLQVHCLLKTDIGFTSSWCNETALYQINEQAVKSKTDETLGILAKVKKPKPTVETAYGTFKYIEWETVRNHRYGKYIRPNFISISDARIEAKGSFYSVFDSNGKFIIRKKIGSTGTEVSHCHSQLIPQSVADFLGIESCSAWNIECDRQRFEREWDSGKWGPIYRKGRLPSDDDVDNGLGNFFQIGEMRVGLDSCDNYRLEEWNGGWWVPVEVKTAT